MGRYIFAAVMIAASASLGAAQAQLGGVGIAPLADGLVSPGEYSFMATKSGARISLALGAEGSVLYAAIDAPTRGYVALGFGSLKMNGASLFMALDKAGKSTVSEQLGSGHGHSEAKGASILASAVKTAAGRTVFEFSLPAAPFISAGKLELVYSFGGMDLFAYHFPFARGNLLVPLAQEPGPARP